MGRNIDHGNELCFLPLDLKEVYTENIHWLSESGDQAQCQCMSHCLVLRERRRRVTLPTSWSPFGLGGECVQFHMILPTDQWWPHTFYISAQKEVNGVLEETVSCVMNLTPFALSWTHLLQKEASWRREERNLVWSKWFCELNGKAGTYKWKTELLCHPCNNFQIGFLKENLKFYVFYSILFFSF